jgi:hypothetical protein
VRWRFSSSVLGVYLALVLLAGAQAGVRLDESTEMPGLAAFELVILALPWSYALGVAPFSHLAWVGMSVIVLGGLALNGLILFSVARAVEQALGIRRDR